MDFIASNPVLMLIGTIALALVLLSWILFVRKPKPRKVRYQLAVTITPREFKALHYLQAAFPDAAVLAQRPLRSLVSPRSTGNSDAAKKALQALDGLAVDFVICNDGGKPAYAFDLDAPGSKIVSEDARRNAAHKNGILKSAGVRLILLKGDPGQWPTPAEFRLKLALAALQPLTPAGEPEVYEGLMDSTIKTPSSHFQESSIMGMSVLMTLEGDDAEAAWRAARN